MKSPRHRLEATTRGVTLVEILISLAVAAIALLALVLFLGVINRATREGKDQAVASTFARTQLEQLRSDPVYFQEVLDNNPLTIEKVESLTEEQAERKAPTRYQVETKLTPLPGNARFYEAEVKVTWEKKEHVRSVRLVSNVPGLKVEN